MDNTDTNMEQSKDSELKKSPIDHMTDEEYKQYGTVSTDCRPLMIQIAEMANMKLSRIKRLVLVLDIDDIPRVYVESYLKAQPEDHKLVSTKLEVKEEYYAVDTTSMQNQKFRTHEPVKKVIDDKGDV